MAQISTPDIKMIREGEIDRFRGRMRIEHRMKVLKMVNRFLMA
jgi:hypothetical protein